MGGPRAGKTFCVRRYVDWAVRRPFVFTDRYEPTLGSDVHTVKYDPGALCRALDLRHAAAGLGSPGLTGALTAAHLNATFGSNDEAEQRRRRATLARLQQPLGGRRVLLQLWDVSHAEVRGQDAHAALLLRDASGVLFVLDAGDPGSLAWVDAWRARVARHVDARGGPSKNSKTFAAAGRNT